MKFRRKRAIAGLPSVLAAPAVIAVVEAQDGLLGVVRQHRPGIAAV